MGVRLPIAVLGLSLSVGCGVDDLAGPPDALTDDAVTVGSFDFAESVLLAELYSQALEARGIRVVRAFHLGPREFVGPALAAGLVEVVPEYAGTAVGFASAGRVVAGADPRSTYRSLEQALDGTHVLALATAPAESTNAFVVTRATARDHHLRRLSDLAAVAGRLRFGGPAECPERPLCLVGLRDRYGVVFGSVSTLDAGGAVTRQALRSGDVDVALMFTTDPAIGQFTELVDDRNLQPAENITPLVRQEVVERFGPAPVEAMDAVSAALDEPGLRALNAADARQPGSADVPAIATAWLDAKGLA